jgi:NAD(P)-dependent dehydrogenase (short-subunit alcohol dehydrogenase family)
VLDGDIAVVVGGSQGIGEAIARALADAGASVAVTSRDAEVARRIAAGLGPGHIGVALDVRSTESVEAAASSVAEHLGATTILVNNAGVNRIGPAETMTDEDWALVLDVNLTGVFRCCRAFGSRMLDAGRGSIVNIASITGAVVGMPGRAPYASSKGGVVGLTRTLAVEWADRGVRVNAVLPGPVRTPMVLQAIEDGILDERQIVDRTPAGRLALPEDVAGAVVLLCAPGAAFVTGQTVVVDGGYSAFGAAHPVRRVGVRSSMLQRDVQHGRPDPD